MVTLCYDRPRVVISLRHCPAAFLVTKTPQFMYRYYGNQECPWALNRPAGLSPPQFGCPISNFDRQYLNLNG